MCRTHRIRLNRLAVLSLVLSACSCASRGPVGHRQSFNPEAQDPWIRGFRPDPALVADYYRPTMGGTFRLTLRVDGWFEAVHTECVGVMGTANGWWYRDESGRVQFVTRQATDGLIGALTSAEVVPGKRSPTLVLAQDRKQFRGEALPLIYVLRRPEDGEL